MILAVWGVVETPRCSPERENGCCEATIHVARGASRSCSLRTLVPRCQQRSTSPTWSCRRAWSQRSPAGRADGPAARDRPRVPDRHRRRHRPGLRRLQAGRRVRAHRGAWAGRAGRHDQHGGPGAGDRRRPAAEGLPQLRARRAPDDRRRRRRRHRQAVRCPRHDPAHAHDRRVCRRARCHQGRRGRRAVRSSPIRCRSRRTGGAGRSPTPRDPRPARPIRMSTQRGQPMFLGRLRDERRNRCEQTSGSGAS